MSKHSSQQAEHSGGRLGRKIGVLTVFALLVGFIVIACQPSNSDLPDMPFSLVSEDKAITAICQDLADGLSPYQIVRTWEQQAITTGHPELTGPAHNQLRLEWVEAVRDKRCNEAVSTD